jgi:tRNA(fMet)-specific endonuclease VapC
VFALDTNTLIYFFKGQGRVGERLLEHRPGEIAIAMITVFEIETGIAKSRSGSRRRRQFDQFLEAVTVLPFDRNAARHAADIRAALEASGQPIGPLDTLIAGTARASNSILVTRNLREFSRVPDLRVTDWFGHD